MQRPRIDPLDHGSGIHSSARIATATGATSAAASTMQHRQHARLPRSPGQMPPRSAPPCQQPGWQSSVPRPLAPICLPRNSHNNRLPRSADLHQASARNPDRRQQTPRSASPSARSAHKIKASASKRQARPTPASPRPLGPSGEQHQQHRARPAPPPPPARPERRPGLPQQRRHQQRSARHDAAPAPRSGIATASSASTTSSRLNPHAPAPLTIDNQPPRIAQDQRQHRHPSPAPQRIHRQPQRRDQREIAVKPTVGACTSRHQKRRRKRTQQAHRCQQRPVKPAQNHRQPPPSSDAPQTPSAARSAHTSAAPPARRQTSTPAPRPQKPTADRRSRLAASSSPDRRRNHSPAQSGTARKQSPPAPAAPAATSRFQCHIARRTPRPAPARRQIPHRPNSRAARAAAREGGLGSAGSTTMASGSATCDQGPTASLAACKAGAALTSGCCGTSGLAHRGRGPADAVPKPPDQPRPRPTAPRALPAAP